MVCTQRDWSRSAIALGIACAVLGTLPTTAQAGEIYGSLGLGIARGIGHASGNNGDATLAPPQPNSGSSSDSSPLIAGVIGFEFPLHELIPRRRRSPSWMPDLDLEDWVLRSEFEIAGARSYDLSVNAGTLEPNAASVDSLTVMITQWVDLPLGPALRSVGLRSRGIDDLTFNLGLGVGYNRARLKTNNGVVFGKEDLNLFTWQVGVELGFPLGHNVTLTGGYRYVDLGDLEASLTDSTGTQDFGRLGLDMGSHEFRAAVRLRFYSMRFPRGLIQPRRRYEP